MNIFEDRKAEKEKILLTFLKDEGFSTAKILGELLGVTRTATFRTLKSLERRGILKQAEVPYEIGKGTPSIWGLTPTGAFLATEDGRYKHFDPNRVSEITIKHELAVQRARVKVIRLGWGGCIGGRDLRKKGFTERSTWPQIPDFFAVSPKGRKVAIEVERTIKTPKRYEVIFDHYCQMLADKTVQEVVYICPKDKALRLKRFFLTIETMTVDGKTHSFSDSFRKRFHFVTYEEWEDYAENF